MEVAGTVTKIIRRKTERGNTVLTVDVAIDSTGYVTRLRYIQVFQPIPEKNQHVTITGVPLMLRGRKPNTNIGAVKVLIG